MSTSIKTPPSRKLGVLLAGGLVAGGIAAGRYLGTSTARLDSALNPPRTFGKGPAFVSLALESSEQVNHNTKRLRFKLPNSEAVSGLALTSSLLTLSWPKGRWLPVPRPYTPVSARDQRGHVELLVKQYPNGKASTHLHSLQPGDRLLVAAALPGPVWTPNAAPRVTLIAGGAGITPVFQLARGILENPADRTAVTLVFAANSDRDVVLLRELRELQERCSGSGSDRLRVVFTVTKRAGDDSPFREGRVNKALLDEVAPATGDARVYLSGPPAMEEALVGSWGKAGILEQVGYRKDQINKF